MVNTVLGPLEPVTVREISYPLAPSTSFQLSLMVVSVAELLLRVGILGTVVADTGVVLVPPMTC